MAYKPPSQTIVDNDTKNFPSSEAIFEALKLKLDEPSVSGTAGQLLQLDGYVSGEPVMSWVNPPASGANTSLSNLSSVAINTALLGTLGTVSAPAYSFTGDTNTGMWSSAGDILNFSTGGVERVRIDSLGNAAFSGKVGIGTPSPNETLEVLGSVFALEFRVANYRLDPHTHNEGTETGNFTINWSNGAVHTVTLNAAGPLVITMNNPVNGGAYALRIIQGATPGTVTWPANVKWPGGNPPVLSTNTGDIDVVNLLYYSDTATYYATFALAFA